MISGHLCCLYCEDDRTLRATYFKCVQLLAKIFKGTAYQSLLPQASSWFRSFDSPGFFKDRRFLSFVYGKPLSVITFVWYVSNVMITTKRNAGRASFPISWVERCFQVLDNKARLNSFFIFVNTVKVFKIGKLNIVLSKNCPALNSTCHRFSETKMFTLSK